MTWRTTQASRNAIEYVNLIAALVCLQLMDAIPRPSYLVRRLGEWVTVTPPHTVDLEIIDMLAFRPFSPSPSDILFIITGCVLLLTSCFHLLTRCYALGSSFLLPLAILSSTSLSFLFALRIAIALDMPIHPTSLSHALPFLIAIIGFDKPLCLAHAILRAPPTYSLLVWPDHANFIPPVIRDALSPVFLPITRASLFELTVLVLAAYFPIGDLRQLCALAALTLAVHYILISSYFVLVLSSIFEGCVLEIAKHLSASNTTSRVPDKSPHPTLSYLLGEKGPSFYKPKYTLESNAFKITVYHPGSEKEIGKHPAWRLKLLIFISFLLFNFVSPLTPSSLSRLPVHQSTTLSTINRTLEHFSPPMIAMLNTLVGPDTAEAGEGPYIKVYPQPSTLPSSFSVYSVFLSLCPHYQVENATLSLSFFTIILLSTILCLCVSLYTVVGPEGLKRYFWGRGQGQKEEKPSLPELVKDVDPEKGVKEFD